MKESIQGTRHAIKFIAKFVAALLKVRTSNLAKIANAVETEVESDSVYRQTQRFLKNENEVVIDYLKLLKLNGKLKIIIDRTEWKFGETWINILTLSVAYKQVAIPILWEVVNHKGNARAAEHIALLKKFVEEFGSARIERAYGDREFGSYELLKYLIDERIDFHIRLKTSHLSGGKSFKEIWQKAVERVKLRGKVKGRSIRFGGLCQLREVSKGRENGVFDCGESGAKQSCFGRIQGEMADRNDVRMLEKSRLQL